MLYLRLLACTLTHIISGGYARFGYKTHLEMDDETKADALAYLAALVDQEALIDWYGRTKLLCHAVQWL